MVLRKGLTPKLSCRPKRDSAFGGQLQRFVRLVQLTLPDAENPAVEIREFPEAERIGQKYVQRSFDP